MKSLITLFTLCVFLSSCSSFKTLDLTKHKIEATKKYKITDSNGNITKTNKCQKIKDSLNCEKLNLPISNIKEIKQRKFSYLKTGVLVVSIIGLEVLILSQSTNSVNIEPIESPN